MFVDLLGQWCEHCEVRLGAWRGGRDVRGCRQSARSTWLNPLACLMGSRFINSNIYVRFYICCESRWACAVSAMFCLARGGGALFFLSSPLPPAPRRWSRHRKKLSGYLISHLKFYFSLVPMLVAPIGEGSGPVGRARPWALVLLLSSPSSERVRWARSATETP